MSLLEKFGTVIEQRRGHHPDRHHVPGRHAPSHFGGGVEEHLLVLQREPGAAVLLREGDTREAGVEDLLLQLVIGERLVALFREVPVDPCTHPLAERVEALHVNVYGLSHQILLRLRGARRSAPCALRASRTPHG